MPDNLIQSVDPDVESEEITQAERKLIYQLRRLKLKRERHIAGSNRPPPMGMIIYENRRYLEQRDNFTPILVPSALRQDAVTFFGLYFRIYLQHRHAQALASQLMLPSSISPAPAPAPFPWVDMTALAVTPNAHQLVSPPGSPLPSPASHATPLLPNFAPTEPASLPWETGQPAMPQFTPPGNAPSSPDDYLSIAILSSPYLPGPAATSESNQIIEEESTEASLLSQPGDKRSKAPELGTGKALDVTKRNRSTPAESLDSKGSGNDADDEILSDEGTHGSCVSELRKPPNAFILYRKAMNKKLREQQPGLSVETASSIIGKYWREESEEVKKEYKEKANVEREKYFVRKKQLQAQQRRLRLEREEQDALAHPHVAGKAQAWTSPEAAHPTIKQELVHSVSRELSSFTPEALTRGIQRSQTASSYERSSQAAIQEYPVRFARSVTLDCCSGNQPDALPLGGPGHFGNEAGSYPMATQGACCVASASMLGHCVASSLEQLSTALSQSLLSPASSTTSTEDGGSGEWTTRLTAEPNDLDGIISSLIRESN